MTGTGATSAIRRALREPTLHFAVLAAVLFVVSWSIKRSRANVIEVDRVELAARLDSVTRESGAALSAEERRRVEQDYVDEQILVREALAMKLDDDPRVRDILVQKMLHVLSADVIQPTDAELREYYDAHAVRYTLPASVTIDEVVIPAAGVAAADVLWRLRRGEPPETVATSLPVRHSVATGVPLRTLVAALGAETAESIFAAAIGTWVGPHTSLRGEHWFRVRERVASESASLRAVRERVRLDWVAEKEEERLARRVEVLRGKYSVVYRNAPDRR